MALIGWILSFIALFGALALRQDMPVGGSAVLSNILLMMAVLSCPMIWRDGLFGVSRGQRIVAALALILCVPILLLPAA